MTNSIRLFIFIFIFGQMTAFGQSVPSTIPGGLDESFAAFGASLDTSAPVAPATSVPASANLEQTAPLSGVPAAAAFGTVANDADSHNIVNNIVSGTSASDVTPQQGFTPFPSELPSSTASVQAIPAPAPAMADTMTANQFLPLPAAPQQAATQAAAQAATQALPPRQTAHQPSTTRQTLPQQVSNSQALLTEAKQPVSVVNPDHPFWNYWGIPHDPQTQIVGKPMSVTDLFSGTRSSVVRWQLLESYWELSGLLAIYHFRLETEKQLGATPEQAALYREQRRTAEVEFIKQQWVLAGLLRQFKGRALRETELPIPTDFPLYPRYQTHADLLARTERTQYLGRMIPLQEQVIESKNAAWKAAQGVSQSMPQSAAQPQFMATAQRTMAFLDLTKAMIEYNQMIAEYALKTMPAHLSQQQLVGAVVRLQKNIPNTEQSPQTATDGLTAPHQAVSSAPPPNTLLQNTLPQELISEAMELVSYQYEVDNSHGMQNKGTQNAETQNNDAVQSAAASLESLSAPFPAVQVTQPIWIP